MATEQKPKLKTVIEKKKNFISTELYKKYTVYHITGLHIPC